MELNHAGLVPRPLLQYEYLVGEPCSGARTLLLLCLISRRALYCSHVAGELGTRLEPCLLSLLFVPGEVREGGGLPQGEHATSEQG